MYLTLYTNEKGEVFEYPGVSLLGRSGEEWLIPENTEMIPLPEGASLVSIHKHIPVSLDERDRLYPLEFDPEGKKIKAVAALLPQGFTRTLFPAVVSKDEKEVLPLMGYAAVGFKDEQIYVAAVQSDEHRKWHPVYYNTDTLPQKISVMLKKYPENRILRQLARCSLHYGCFTAQNIFYGRWEGGIPSIAACNANCIGCISESHIDTDSPQNRIDFIPSVEEVAELGIEHLLRAKEGIISFGQGCEGEPSLNADKLAASVKKIRSVTGQGTINMNSNAGYTVGIKKMCDAGMDALRVTLFSTQEENYDFYHRPKNYSLTDVENSITYAKEKGLKVSLNLLTFPGFNDREGEIESLITFVKEFEIDMIQLRNLNIDPRLLFAGLTDNGEALGVKTFIEIIKEEIPEVEIGSYTHPVR